MPDFRVFASAVRKKVLYSNRYPTLRAVGTRTYFLEGISNSFGYLHSHTAAATTIATGEL